MSQLSTLAVAMVLITLAEGQDSCIEQNCPHGSYCRNNRCSPCEHFLPLCEESTLEIQKYPTCLHICDDHKRGEQNLTAKLAITTNLLQEAVHSNRQTILALKYKCKNEVKNTTKELMRAMEQIKNLRQKLANTTNQLQEEEKHNGEMATQLRIERIVISVALGISWIMLCGAVFYIIKLRYNYRQLLVPVPRGNTSLPDSPGQQNGSLHSPKPCDRLLLPKDQSHLSTNGCLAKGAQQKNVSAAASPLLVYQLPLTYIEETKNL